MREISCFSIFTALVFGILISIGFFFDRYPSIVQANDFTAAAKANSELKYTLKWSLGQRPQRGWYLYSLLIQETIKTEGDANSTDFARSVAEWQVNHDLTPNGIVEQKTLLSFIDYWQSRRIRPIKLADENELLYAPIEDFFDPTRESDLLKVERETYKAYKKMVAAALADEESGISIDGERNPASKGDFLKIISSYRSPAYQESLRKKLPGASRAQIAFISPHFTGRALDIYVGGEPVTTKDFNRAIQVKTPAYKWLVWNAARFGFYNYFYEPWHWEYVPENLATR